MRKLSKKLCNPMLKTTSNKQVTTGVHLYRVRFVGRERLTSIISSLEVILGAVGATSAILQTISLHYAGNVTEKHMAKIHEHLNHYSMKLRELDARIIKHYFRLSNEQTI